MGGLLKEDTHLESLVSENICIPKQHLLELLHHLCHFKCYRDRILRIKIELSTPR
jgi:hypothetical protein